MELFSIRIQRTFQLVSTPLYSDFFHKSIICLDSASPDSARRFSSLYQLKEEYPSGGVNLLFSISFWILFRFIASSS